MLIAGVLVCAVATSCSDLDLDITGGLNWCHNVLAHNLEVEYANEMLAERGAGEDYEGSKRRVEQGHDFLRRAPSGIDDEMSEYLKLDADPGAASDQTRRAELLDEINLYISDHCDEDPIPPDRRVRELLQLERPPG